MLNSPMDFKPKKQIILNESLDIPTLPHTNIHRDKLIAISAPPSATSTETKRKGGNVQNRRRVSGRDLLELGRVSQRRSVDVGEQRVERAVVLGRHQHDHAVIEGVGVAVQSNASSLGDVGGGVRQRRTARRGWRVDAAGTVRELVRAGRRRGRRATGATSRRRLLRRVDR